MMDFFGIKYKYLIIFALLLQGFFAYAQTLKVDAKFDSTTILIGDQVKLHIYAEFSKGTKIKFPSFSDTLTSKISIISVSPIDTLIKDDKISLHQSLLVTSFDSGFHQILPLAFPFEMEMIKDTIRSTVLSLNVLTVSTEKASDIKDIKPPYQAPFTLAEIWLFILLGVLIVILGFVIWFLIRKNRKEPVFSKKKPAEPPHVIALRELDILRAEKLWQQNKIKQYYTRLTETIRIYIEQRFGISAMEQTSDEILQSFKGVYLEDITTLDLLKKIFTTADLVKFAKSHPLPDENEISILNAYQFVNNTKIIVIQSSEQADTGYQVNAEVSNDSKQDDEEYRAKLIIQEKFDNNIVWKVFFWIKKIRLKYRIGILLGLIFVLSFESLPDFIFNIKQKQPKELSIAEISSMSDSDIPRYIEVKEAVVPKGGYIKVTKRKYGVELLDHICYPVYQINSDTTKDGKAFILVKDFHAKKDELENGTYFNSLFRIGGKFEGDRVTSQDVKLLEDHGINIDSNAIVIIKDSVALSFGVSILISILCIIVILVIAFSFFSRRTMEKIIGQGNSKQ
jgi:hypothetical protein